MCAPRPLVWQDHAPRRRQRRRTLSGSLRALGVGTATLALVAAALLLGGDTAFGGTSGGVEGVTVHSGDTLWSIAADHYPGEDLRARVDEIIAANHLRSAVLVPGERLALPPP